MARSIHSGDKDMPATASPSSQTGDPAAAFRQMKTLLSAKDDTSRFVGLALLKAVLDNQSGLMQDENQLKTLWSAISPRFLDRLLRSGKNQNVSKAEAKDMVDIAVGVLYTFTILLPVQERKSKRLVGRINALVDALIKSEPEGAFQLLKLEDISPLTEIATQQVLVLDIIGLAWSNASAERTKSSEVQATIDTTMPELLAGFKHTDAVTFLAFIGDTLPKLAPEALPHSPPWIKPVVSLLQKLAGSRPTKASRAAYTQCSAALLQAFPSICPRLLFGAEQTSDSETKPFYYLFITLLLVDIRSSIPSLLAKLNSPDYPGISMRLAAAFDVMSSFIGFLLREAEDGAQIGSMVMFMSPDLLLKLRKDIAETMSLTIEYMRDRWDASVAGAAGLHSSARTGAAEGTMLTLTWESMKDNVDADPLILAAIRALSIWLREDENENLRNESAGLTDMFIGLYQASSGNGTDFRYPILAALEANISTEEGVEIFLNQNGWDALATDLMSMTSSTTTQRGTQDENSQDVSSCILTGDASRGIEIVRILLAVVDHESMREPREDWMSVIGSTASMRHLTLPTNPLDLELRMDLLLLSVALLDTASPGAQRRYKSYLSSLLDFASQLRSALPRVFGGVVLAEYQEQLSELTNGLEKLR
ncbi:MAG: hypothetical protein M1818_007186 [Claussenomyces sp. TS43310]|nr:MAG: hypothetical protein M1818_007186 [Claussenomyces sp. TS43310]